ncbi:hypothetical protein ABZS84_03835 [Streptomyces sp. NPDC005481]|uniref:hypothetical protein n=1 Tax=Streptomyces sp. NPDC005481 TaxID=3154881 RepID=UPI0033B73180
MAVGQLPHDVREFTAFLNGLLTRLDQRAGWCAVFWQRDPEGMRACLDGWEVPPWDVVEALLQDLAAQYGAAAAAGEAERARALHDASLAAHDARPGGRDALGDRLDVMLREQRYAAERRSELGRLLHSAASPEEAEAVRLDLAWAHDDHDRATARCAELRRRMQRLDLRAAPGRVRGTAGFPAGRPGGVGAGRPAEGTGTPWSAFAAQPAPGARGGPDSPGAREPAGRAPGDDTGAARAEAPYRATPAERPAPTDPAASVPGDARPPVAAPAPSVPKQRAKRRPRGGARFAGMVEAEEAPVAAPAVAPVVPAPRVQDRSPRGARFAGAAEEPERPQPRREPLDDEARRDTVDTVATLVRLRAEGRSGEAHALLVEAAHWPAARFPLLAAELHRAGLDADWATLLWEAASLPADRLVAAADALVAAGRVADGRQMLRQGVARPAPEIGAAVLGLEAAGRHRDVRVLLDAYVRVRTPEEAARSAEADPPHLVPLLLESARGASEERYWDLVHALRVAGFAA